MEKTYFWHRIFPELPLFENREQRKAAWRRAITYPRRRFYLYYLVSVTAAAGAMAVVLAFLLVSPPLSVPIPRQFISGAVAISLGMLAPTVSILILRRRIQRSLRQQLNEHGRPVCLVCGYDLRGQTVPRCPECGTAFDEALLPNSELPARRQDRKDG